jgi:hypothetical protein
MLHNFMWTIAGVSTMYCMYIHGHACGYQVGAADVIMRIHPMIDELMDQTTGNESCEF